MTLICLLTGTKADDIGQLVDISYKVKFKHLVPKLSQHWVTWLEKMVEPRDKDRFANAKAALEALPVTAIHPPEVRLSQSKVQFMATKLRETLQTVVVVSNPVPETALAGHWKIEPYPSDGGVQLDDHPWITISPLEFASNQVDCTVVVDTRRLMAGTVYRRMLRLHTNASPQVYTIPLEMATAPLPVRSAQLTWAPLLLLFGFTVFASRLLLGLTFSPGLVAANGQMVGFAFALGSALGLKAASWTLAAAKSTMGVWASGVAAMVVAGGTVLAAWFVLGNLQGGWELFLVGAIPGVVGGLGMGLALGLTVETLTAKTMGRVEATVFGLGVAAVGVGLSLGLTFGFKSPWLFGTLLATSLAVLSMALNAPLTYARQVADFRRMERDRIQP